MKKAMVFALIIFVVAMLNVETHFTLVILLIFVGGWVFYLKRKQK